MASSRQKPRGAAYVVATVLLGMAALPAFAFVLMLVGYIALVALTGSRSTEQFPPSVFTTVALVLEFGPVFLFTHLWLLAREHRPLWTVGFASVSWVRRYLTGWLVGIGLFTAPVVAMAAAGFVHVDERAGAIVGLSALPGVALLIVGWAVQGAGEEVLTRGLMLQTVAARFGPWAGVVTSSIVFAAMHSLNANLTALAIANLFLFGVFACLVALREGSLWGICAIHSAWNWTQGQVFGLAVSGGAVPGGSLLGLGTTGPDIVTGGAFGPEGGLAVTGVLMVGITLVLATWRGALLPVQARYAHQHGTT